MFLATFSQSIDVAVIHRLVPTSAVAAPHATVIFGGDMMFDRSVRTAVDEQGGDFLFNCIDGTLEGADLVVANLEGPITDNDSQSVGSQEGAPDNYVFTFPPSTAVLLLKHHVEIVNLGNNHILNFGIDGVHSTIAALDAAGVQHFGDPLTQSVASTTIKGVNLAFINYNEFAGGTAAATVEQIQIARLSGQVPVVYAHWGIEYATTSPQYVHTLAHEFVDAGAAIVIGSHPHVVEDHETYKGVPIYYSLGNFIFDQYWDDTVDHGLLLSVSLSPGGAGQIQEIPIVLQHDRHTCLTPVQ